MNTTKEGIEVKPGQVWEDLDKRMLGRRRQVREVSDGYAYMDGYPRTRVAIRRMHRHSTGWKLVRDTSGSSESLSRERP